MHRFPRALHLQLLLTLGASVAVRADEGMWTFDNVPVKQIKDRYGFEPTKAWLDHVRRQIRFRIFAERYREEMPVCTDGGIGKLRKRLDIQAALDRLSPKLREVLVLAVHQGLAYDEIAAILSIPVGTVKSRVFNALSTLQEMFDEKRP